MVSQKKDTVAKRSKVTWFLYVFGIMDAGEYGSAPRPPEIDYGYDNARTGEIGSKMFSKVVGCFLSEASKCPVQNHLRRYLHRSERVKIAPVCRKTWCAKCTSGCLLHRARETEAKQHHTTGIALHEIVV